MSGTWNWQKSDWPHFRWDESRLRAAEDLFLAEAGCFVGMFKHLPESDRQELTVEVISREVQTTSEIEGEILDRISVQSSIRKQLGLGGPKDRKKVERAEEGISEMMVNLYRSYKEPLSENMLFRWHTMLFGERHQLRPAQVGCYRIGEEPMQVVSGRVYQPTVHFEAPPSARVKAEVRRFLAWFNRTAPAGDQPLPTLTRAGIAHIYFESIHPFEDGNGRIGRAISEKALAQGFGQPALTALAATILAKRKAYYANLEAANKGNELTVWLSWFAGMAVEAQRRTASEVDFLIQKARLLDRVRGQINARQEKALLRVMREGAEGFEGGLSSANYRVITRASPATASRDLLDLVEKGALRRVGELRHARYFLTIQVKKVKPVILDQRGRVAFGKP